MSTEAKCKKVLADITNEVYQKGYTPPLNGNMSVRLDEEHILITPSYVCKKYVTPDNILKVNMDGEVIGSQKKPSIETGMHIALYKHRAEVNGVIHAHPKSISVFAVAQKSIDLSIMPEAVYLLGEVKCIDYYMPGSDELKDAVEQNTDYDAFLLFNHGMITVGRDIYEAFYRLESLELCAQLQLQSQLLGGAKGLTDTEIKKLLDVRKSLLKPCNN